ncbi:hypothetical protein [Priestia megaterium]|uniref:hypothetical protein n=1 Tax=Priestia megaterium TaxID=1404 RepID=UPI001596FE54|nr:hypothetical protein [Priestia megaterium]
MTTQNENLRQLENTVEIVGTLKSKELEVKTSRAGNKYMSGKLVVSSKFDNKVQDQVIKVFIMASSKLFKGIETVKNEYRTIDADGVNAADRIRVTGEMKLNEYYNSQGKLVQFNEIKGVFFNRLDETNDQPDKAIASIETVVEGFVDKLDKDNLPTGEFKVNGFTVGFGNDVIELQNAVIGADLAASFMSLYQPGQTGRLTFKLNNYVLVEEQEVVEQAPSHGFGSTETIEANVIKDYVNNMEIIGGDMPLFAPKEYSVEEIAKAKQVRALKLQEMQQPAPPTPPANTGFGQGVSTQPNTPPINVDNQMPTNFGKDSMPDF